MYLYTYTKQQATQKDILLLAYILQISNYLSFVLLSSNRKYELLPIVYG